LGSERPNELNVGIGGQHHVLLRRRDRGQLDHLLLDPATYRGKRPAQGDHDITERYSYERARQQLGLATDVRTWTRKPTEQLEVRPRHDDVMLDRIWRVLEH